MIPAFEQPHLRLGPLTIHAFGVLVAVALLVGHAIFRRWMSARGLDRPVGDRLFTYVVLGGLSGAHLVDRLVYFPAETWRDPLSLLRFWSGLSSFGGFLGAVLGVLVFSLVAGPTGFPREQRLSYLDGIAYAFPFGWIAGRLGCFLAYDHPGAPTSFFLGQRYPKDGVIRHNLGLEEAIFTVILAAVFFGLARRPRRPGFYLGLLPLLYAPVRFALDFLRLVDVRYAALTPGQWGALALLLVGIAVLLRTRTRAV